YSILHSREGAAAYVNRYQEPAFFGVNEVNNDIRHYSRKIGESPRITRMPHRADFPTGILASWGKVELEPLDEDSIRRLPRGGLQPQKNMSLISSATSIAQLKRVYRYTASVEVPGSFGLRALIRKVAVPYASQQ